MINRHGLMMQVLILMTWKGVSLVGNQTPTKKTIKDKMNAMIASI